jgi:dTDP-4-amino-4,6-dideoxygalactose transaminase
MGLVNLDSIDEVLKRNYSNYCHYRSIIANIQDLALYQLDEQANNNYQYIVIEIKGASRAFRDYVVRALHAENILARRYFWPGCHGMAPYSSLYPHANLLLKNTIDVSERVVVLPTGMAVDKDQIEKICSILKLLMSHGRVDF